MNHDVIVGQAHPTALLNVCSVSWAQAYKIFTASLTIKTDVKSIFMEGRSVPWSIVKQFGKYFDKLFQFFSGWCLYGVSHSNKPFPSYFLPLFALQDNDHARKIYFHINVCAPRLVLTRRWEIKWLIGLVVQRLLGTSMYVEIIKHLTRLTFTIS